MANVIPLPASKRQPRPAEAVARALSAGDITGGAALARAAILSGLDDGGPAISLYWCRLADRHA